MAVPYTFGSATTSIPLSQLDSNFATTITLGNTAIQLGNTVTTLNNMTMANVTVSSASTPVPEAAGGTGTTTGYYGFKNRIINGAMVIDQRNAGASVSVQSATGYTLDRWNTASTQNSKFSVQQNAGSVTPPVGFTNYLGVTSSSAYTVGASELFTISQPIEAFNTADLVWGTANAKTVTVSFQVYSSLTGTFGGALRNATGSRCYPFSYSIASANTWTSISVTIAGDTSGTWAGSTNGIGIYLSIGLGVGSTLSGTAGSWSTPSGAGYFSATGATSVVGTNGATFYITGVQLEKGSTATSFDYRPYGTELQLCQRYYEKSYDISVVPGTATSNSEYASFYGFGATSTGSSTNAIEAYLSPYKVTKRASPTVTSYSNGGTSGQATRFYTGVSPAGDVTNTINNITSQNFKANVASGSAANSFFMNWTASAEL